MYEELRERLQRRGLARRAEAIIRLTAPTIRLTCQRTEETFLLGIGLVVACCASAYPKRHWQSAISAVCGSICNFKRRRQP